MVLQDTKSAWFTLSSQLLHCLFTFHFASLPVVALASSFVLWRAAHIITYLLVTPADPVSSGTRTESLLLGAYS